MSKTRQILESFFDPFWDDIQGFGKVKNKGFVWEGCIFFDFQVFREKVRFGIDFGRVLGRVLGGFWTSKTEKKGGQEGSKDDVKKQGDKNREILSKPRRPAAERWAPGREDLGPKLALMNPARHSTLPLEGGGGFLSAKRSAASSP